MASVDTAVKLICRHCGDPIENWVVESRNEKFCCEGCKTVFELLEDNGMHQYYSIDENPGISLKGRQSEEYAFLDNPQETAKFLDFESAELHRIRLFIPLIHCSSCIWLLENLGKLTEGIIENRVDFMGRTLSLAYDPRTTSLRKVLELLDRIGYKAELNHSAAQEKKHLAEDKKLVFRIGVAGFAFGNIMLFSFPEYLGLTDKSIQLWFSYLNIALSIPVLFFSGWLYIQSAWKALSNKMLNIDVPISLGIAALFGRSFYDIITHTGPGYLDSFAGLIFFLLIGRWYQGKTYRHINFEKDYKSYFPISVYRLVKDKEEQISLDEVEAGDVLMIKNNQVIPADVILLDENTGIDYSFVTGESELTPIFKSEKIFAGGRLKGPAIRVKVLKRIENSYLIGLWNSHNSDKHAELSQNLTDHIAKYFTAAIISISLLSFAYWWNISQETAWTAAISVLIIACPCALALAIPFIYGNMTRLWAKNGIFLKASNVIGTVSQIQHIAFDKTGTLTDETEKKLFYKGEVLSTQERKMMHALCFQSIHPLSVALEKMLREKEIFPAENFKEYPGLGMEAEVNGHFIQMGSAAFIDKALQQNSQETRVYIKIDGQTRGYYSFHHRYRKLLATMIDQFKTNGYTLSLISGDNDKDRSDLERIFGPESSLYFKQNPADKSNLIKKWQQEGDKVAMIGDGLNDTSALKQSDLGIVLTSDINNFTPEGDIVYSDKKFDQLIDFFLYSRKTKKLVYGAYLLAFLYNTIGLYFAVTGQLSPVIAAILMPISSITIVIYALISTRILMRFFSRS
jgi:P-type Cu+ transporter